MKRKVIIPIIFEEMDLPPLLWEREDGELQSEDQIEEVSDEELMKRLEILLDVALHSIRTGIAHHGLMAEIHKPQLSKLYENI